MAACNICSELGRKLHKRWYMQYKMFVCTKCVFIHEDEFDKELVNGYSENASSRS